MLEEKLPVEEEKVEEPVEAEAIEPSKEEKQPEAQDGEDIITKIKIERPEAGDPNFFHVVEGERLLLHSSDKKSKLISRITMIFILGFGIASVALLNVNQMLCYIFLGCAVATLVVSLIITKRIARPDVKGYVKRVNIAFDRHIFDYTEYSDVYFEPNIKLQLNEVMQDGVYKDMSDIVSRNYVEGKFNGASFFATEGALFTGDNRKTRRTMFVGKYVSTRNDLHFEGRYVFVLKGAEDVDQLNAVEDLEVQFDENKKAIYGPKGRAFKSELDKEFVKRILKIETNSHLLQCVVVVSAGRSVAYLSYDDETMTLPYAQPFKASGIDKFKDDLYNLLGAFELLRKD